MNELKDKDYRIEIKVKNNVLYKLMLSKGIESIAELSRLSGLGLPRLYQYMNLTTIPYAESKYAKVKEGVFKPSAEKLADFLNVTVYEMFPIQHLDKPLLTNKAESEMSFEELGQYVLPDSGQSILEDGLYGPEQIVFEGQKRDAVDEMLKTLTKNEETAIRLYYGFDGNKEQILSEIGKHLERKHPHLSSEPLTKERVRHILAKGLRKMRHKERSNKLRKFY